jgi:hypothetical protein
MQALYKAIHLAEENYMNGKKPRRYNTGREL